MKIHYPPTDANLEAIRLAKQKRNMRSKDLARKASISVSALSALEGGYGNSRPALEAVCSVLGLEVTP
jgi:transcriptional regulator with XRE-family HTH domain